MNRESLIAATIAVAGCALLAYGLWLAWPPLGFITAGVLLLATDTDWLRPARRKG